MNPIRLEMPVEIFEPAAHISYSDDVDAGIIASGPDLYEFQDPIHWKADITNTGDALLVTGTVEGQAKASCARCLEDAIVPITGELEGFFCLTDDGSPPEDLEGDEYDVLGADKTIDMAPIITQAILLDLPRIALCSDDCKGLCPKCGSNLNEGDCGCRIDADVSSNSPFAALKDFKFDD